jgi:putative CocE/NonD family hydrolase
MANDPTRATGLPHRVTETENCWIPMPDGARLAARLWMPENAEREPVPAILEYIPYRKRDFTAYRDSINHPYMAGHGYACVRVDLRGSGESDGVLTDEYLERELQDGCEVLRWIASQTWCTGDVGMIGISWGGFNALQIAARRPPQLKAVISLSSTDDRYADDVHHMGGCLLGDNLSWASVMFSYNSLPPDPALVGERWRAMWHDRLDGSGLWLDTWLRHQSRDDYWKHGSICEDYAAIECPVMAVSGWADGYSNSVFRLVSKLSCPRKGLIGPWSHAYPHVAEPGPAIGFLQEAVRWWDYWLKGIDTGIAGEPMLRVWMQDSVPPTTSYPERPGRWIAEKEWPSANIEPLVYALQPATLAPARGRQQERALTIQSPLTLGLFAGKWCSYAAGPDLAHDQRQEDGGALLFDSPLLEEPLEIMGAPSVELTLASDRPLAMIAVRLSDIAANGEATRVTYGMLNLTHRNGSEQPELLEPGRRYRVRVRLNDVAQVFPRGHRLRLALSTSYWPLAWPPPTPVRLTVFSGTSTLTLPKRQPRPGDAQLRAFDAPAGAPPCRRTMIEPPHHNWLVHRDLASDTSTLEVINDSGTYVLDEIGLEVRSKRVERYSSRADDFQSVRGETESVRELKRGDWHVKTITHTVLTSSETTFRLRADLDAYEGSTRRYCRSWDTEIDRHFC